MFYTENAATLLIVPLCLYTIAFAALPLPLRSRLGSSGFQTVALNYNSTAQINLTLSVGLQCVNLTYLRRLTLPSPSS